MRGSQGVDVREDAVAKGWTLVDRHGADDGRPGEFDLLGRTWSLLPGVFAPIHTVSTEFFSTAVPYPVAGSFLEVGCGAGVTAVTAALSGCARVTAVDISEAAVANAQANVERHGVADRARVFRSDVFDAVDPADRFDVIFWNSNVIDAPPDFEYTHELQWAFFDKGYAAHARYLAQGPRLLAPGGRMFLGFNTLGNIERLRALADEARLTIATVQERTGKVGGIPVDICLLELIPDDGLGADV